MTAAGTAAAGDGFAFGIVLGAEAGAAPAGTDGVRIIDLKSTADVGCYIVDNRSYEVTQARVVHDYGQSVNLKDLVRGLDVFIQGHTVLQSAASSARNIDAQVKVFTILLFQ